MSSNKKNSAQSWEKNLEKRSSYSLQSRKTSDPCPHTILLSPSDQGVVRNGGKRGAKHAPYALMSPFKKLVAQNTSPSWSSLTVSSLTEEVADFIQAQELEAQNISEAIKNSSSHTKKEGSFLHLGGGHDHVYPLGKALIDLYGGLIVLNIDAHLDTRTDSEPHSGTPFRQLHQYHKQSEAEGPFKLLQYGIHNFANVKDNFEGLENMTVLPNSSPVNFDYLNPEGNNYPMLLSLDCDGLDASYMPAVSAPNHKGLSKEAMEEVLNICQKHWQDQKIPAFFGIYEFNPVFDSVSQSAARFVAKLMFDFLHRPLG